jgi:hypothetical protein
VWVAVPGARRRVFYFAAVISSERPFKTTQGERVVSFRKGIPMQVAKLLNTKQKLSGS